MNIDYGTPTSTGGAPPVTIACAPPSGSSFDIGSTAIVCTATDTRGRTSSCSFNIVVRRPPQLQLTRFVAFGDSLTAGEDGRSQLAPSGAPGSMMVRPLVLFPFSQTYPGALQGSLQARYSEQTPAVTNQGLPGELAGKPDTLSRFSRAVAGGQVDIVLLMEGSNDVNDKNTGPAIANLRTMLRDAKSRGIRPYLATIPPEIPNNDRGRGAALVPDFNNQVRDLAASESVPLVDVYAALNTAPADYIGFDGLHPNEKGYAKIADTFFDSIKATLEVKATAMPTRTLAVPTRGSSYSPARRRP